MGQVFLGRSVKDSLCVKRQQKSTLKNLNIFSNGSITLKLEVIEMVNDVIWIPSNSNDSKVKLKLAAKDGDLVSIQKGSF